jgi:two-component system NtrC family response regulator
MSVPAGRAVSQHRYGAGEAEVTGLAAAKRAPAAGAADGRVLIIEDDEAVRTQLRWGLCERFEVWLAEDADAARAAIHSAQFDAVSLDLGLPPDPGSPAEGLRLLEEVVARDPATKVVVLTGAAERQHAVRAVRLGAYDYYEKPVDLRDLGLVLERACRMARLDRDAHAVAGEPPGPPGSDMIGDGPAMQKVFDTVRRVARTDVTVLISGESGTGKELVARAIHAKSPRRQRPFVAINCGAIPENLVESELFGHEKGTFTGAHAQRKGRLEVADGGTVFLDEVVELPTPVQVKLLRVLQERHLERVGGREIIPLDVRVLAATNRDLRRAIREGRLREDFYYRLAVVRIELPPLRDRLQDLRGLATRLLARFSAEYNQRPRPYSAEALTAMHLHAWPGNIRELENRIKRAVILAEGRRITAADLELDVQDVAAGVSLKAARNDAERRVLVEAMQRHQGNISQAARAVQISRPAFHELLAKHGLRARSFKAREAETMESSRA